MTLSTQKVQENLATKLAYEDLVTQVRKMENQRQLAGEELHPVD
jgi:hypothetical protein